MKNWGLVLLGATLFATATFAGNDFRVEHGQLPEEARSFLHENFDGMRIVSITMDKDTSVSYEVSLADGTKVESACAAGINYVSSSF